ncbi:MAG: flagellar biosynthesis protein FlhB [Rickettsiales bacterium]|nr:flagellar biosynthesis protein FlhB [Rickettsiales bacterium]
MAEGDDDLEKTEEPTSRRIDQAVEKGQVAFSREITSFLFFVYLAVFILWLVPKLGQQGAVSLSSFIEYAGAIRISRETASKFFYESFGIFFELMIIPLGVTIIVALISSFMQNGVVFSAEPLMPKLEKISLIAGIKRIFSGRSILEFIKGIIKITIIGYITYSLVVAEIEKIINLPSQEVFTINEYTLILCFKIVLYVAAIMMIIALVDFLYQRFEYLKNLRMSKQELKEEFKQTEGNPEVKAKLKQIREQRARRRMMAAVPKADVVIRNPTHYAIALLYKTTEMKAPTIIAMGQDDLALKIIEVAEENEVPVVTNRNLAKSLYQTCDLDEEIPIEHYKAVAEVIAYVYKLKQKV